MSETQTTMVGRKEASDLAGAVAAFLSDYYDSADFYPQQAVDLFLVSVVLMGASGIDKESIYSILPTVIDVAAKSGAFNDE